MSRDSAAAIPFRGLISLCAGFFMELVFGVAYTSGNLMPYIISYMRRATGQDLMYRYVRPTAL